jgi:APA family basic amino acid/polyamine antiporter
VATESGTPAGPGPDVQSLVGDQRVFVRNATGLVRSSSALDMAVFNICGNMVVPFSTGLFWAYAVFPRANMPLAILCGGILCSFTWVCWALLAATMPKTGGGYIYNSRVLHPLLGFSADWLNWIGTVIAFGLWTTWLSTVALNGAFATWGALRSNAQVAGWSTTVLSQNWIFGLGIPLILAVFACAVYSLKLSMRLQNITFFVSTAGLLVACVVLVLTSKSTYISNFNSFAQAYTHKPDSYHDIIAQAKANGFQPPSIAGYSTRDTFNAIYMILTVSIWAWSSAYLAGEMRGARSVKRQLGVMVGSGATQIMIILVATLLFLRTAGTDFFSSINYLNTIGKNPLPAPPYYTLLAGVAISNPIVVGFIVFSFVFGIWCGLWELIGVASRPLFAYSFDGILPKRVADVNSRTHTPIVALGVLFVGALIVHSWASFSTFPSGFFKAWTYTGLFAFVMMAVTAISAVLLPYRRKADYERSPARRSFLGVPVISIFGVLSLVTCGVYFWIVDKYTGLLVVGVTLRQLWVATILCTLSGVLIYFVAKAVRAREGVRLEAAFTEIPPD